MNFSVKVLTPTVSLNCLGENKGRPMQDLQNAEELLENKQKSAGNWVVNSRMVRKSGVQKIGPDRTLNVSLGFGKISAAWFLIMPV
jgi:hypothetical protein